MSTYEGEFQDELQPVIARLEAERPTATALELDEVKQRVLTRTANRSRRRTQRVMRSRAGIVATLVLGLVLSTSGAGLAVSGFADNNQAAVAQYGKSPGGGGNVLGGTDKKPRPSAAVLPGRQTETLVSAGSGSQLPFTGFAAIPVLLLGIGLLSAGFVLRRTGRRA
jgi:hypothetical protein